MNGNSHTARSPSLLSTHQSQRYLHQRIRELEHELEQKRLELFASEEARTELEARVNVDAYVKGSAMVSASCHTTDSYEDWQLNTQEEVENALRARNEEHELVLQDLHNYYRGFIAAIKNFHVVRRKAELQELQDDHCRIIDQIQEDHYAIRKKERLELVNNHLSMTAGAEKLEKAKFEQVKEEMCATYDIVLAHRDQRHDKAMAELQDAFQAELRLSNKDHEQEKTQLQQAHEAEKATMIKNHEAEHKAEVAEFDALRSVSEAMVEKCLNTRFSSHQAEIEAMETGMFATFLSRLSFFTAKCQYQ